MEPVSQSKERYARVGVIVACFCMVCVCLGFCSSNKSLYLSAITEALGIKRSLFSLNDSFRYVSTAVVNLYFGTLISKYGAKKLVGAGFLALILSTLIYATASNVVLFYFGGCFLGIGLSWTTTTMVSYLVNRWCSQNRGTITGLTLCANGLGGALAAQIVTPIIYEQDNPFGYRNAYFLVAALLLIVGILVTLLIREPKAQTAITESKKKAKGNSWCGLTLAEAKRKPYFYAAAVCVFITGMSLQGINGISAAHLSDVGIDAGTIAMILSVHSVVLCTSKFLAGFSYDKLGLRVTLIICQLFGIFSFLALLGSGDSTEGTLSAFAWAAMSALALPLETVMVPLIASDLFGEKEYPKIMGIFVSVNTAGFALGTPVANLVYDSCGTYRPVLLTIAVAMLAVMLGIHFVINVAEYQKKALEDTV